jgi:hypothetical protein
MRNAVLTDLNERPTIQKGSTTNQIYWTVGRGKGFVAINGESQKEFQATVSTGLAPGKYCNCVLGYMGEKGDCEIWPGVTLKNGQKVLMEVDDKGLVKLGLKSSEVLAIFQKV